MNKKENNIAGLGFDKAYESGEEFVKDLLKRCPNAAVVNPDLCKTVSNQEDHSED